LPTLTLRKDTTKAFSSVTVSWRHDDSLGAVSVSLRAKTAGGAWGSWDTADEAESDSKDGVATARASSELLWTGRSAGVEVAVTSVSGRAPSEVEVELIDPGSSAADADPDAGQPAAQANAGLEMPRIYTRAQWGASESQMSWPPDYVPSIKAIVVHHTVNSNNYSASEVPAMLRSIYYYHAVSHGWGDIGYNVIVDRFGRLWEGRAGGITRAVIGAHAGGFNSYTSGISMLGDFSTAEVPGAMREAVARYAAWKLSLYGVNPQGTTQLTGGHNTKYSGIVTVTVPTIFPHRQTSLTSCPGSGGMRALPWIRARTQYFMGRWSQPAYFRAQVSTYNPANGVWYFRSGATVQWGLHGDVPQPGDYSGDSVAEVVVYRPTSGGWWQRGGQTLIWGTPSQGDIPVSGYYSRRGARDYAVWRNSTGQWWVRGMQPVTWGATGDKPVPADYNGDGQDDFAVFTPSTYTWKIRGGASVVWGVAGDIPVPADYNGDGRADIAVYRPSTGQWWILGNPASPVTWGIPGRGDVPEPYLYDNNRTADLAVWRASTATWWVRGSGTVKEGGGSHIPLVYD
jgi:hypothetical protein